MQKVFVKIKLNDKQNKYSIVATKITAHANIGQWSPITIAMHHIISSASPSPYVQSNLRHLPSNVQSNIRLLPSNIMYSLH